MHSKFTKSAENALSSALEASRSLGHTYVGTEHILLGLLSEKNGIAYKILSSRGLSYSDARSYIIEENGKGSRSNVSSEQLTPKAREIIEQSSYEALKYGQPYIGTEHLLITLVCENDSTGARVINAMGLKLAELYTDTLAFLDNGNVSGKYEAREKRTKLRGAEMPTLRKYGKDLTEAALCGGLDPLIGRDEECESVIKALLRRGKNNPCLIGEAGVGKTAVVEGLAQRIASGCVPPELEGKTIFSLDLPAMLAGAKYRGEFEDRLKSVMNELKKNPDVILFIDEIHTIAGAGAAEGAIDAANILKPALARGELKVIGATTCTEYRKIIEKDSALERRFCKINVDEPSKEQCKRILLGLRGRLQEHHKVNISDEAVDAALELSIRYIPERFLPDKAIDLLDEASSAKHIRTSENNTEQARLKEKLNALSEKKDAAIRGGSFDTASKLREQEKRISSRLDELRRKTRNTAKSTEPTVNASDIAQIVTLYTSIPTDRVKKSEAERLLSLECELEKRIVGQKHALSAVARAVRRGRVGLKSPKRPTGSFIFTGPSGVGKTELCKALADTVYGSEKSIIRLDMSEYTEKHSASRLTGAPPGYVGYDEGGQLTEAVRKHPYSLVLFDEIEKADRQVLDLLLQILDEGTLTDGGGRCVSFKNCIIVMTSNATGGVSKQMGFSKSDAGEKTASRLKETFRPELINRVDEIIEFKPLGVAEKEAIAKRMLAELCERAKEIGIEVRYSQNVPHALAEKCSDDTGARELRHIIDEYIEDPLASSFLDGTVNTEAVACLEYKNGNFVWENKKQIIYS